MEQTANNNPSSATAQNAFYAALLRADMPAVVVERYQTGRFASNSACQNTYTKALERLGSDNGAELASGGGATFGIGQSQGVSPANMQAVAQAIAARANGGSAAYANRNTDVSGQGSKKAPLYVVTEESWGQVLYKWVKMLMYFGLVVYIVLVGIHLVVDATGILRRATGSQVVEASTQTARFADVQGCDDAKEELVELVEFLKDPKQFSTLGGKLPKGVLLTGPPGTGKTLLARAVAGEAGVPFFYMAGSEFDEIYVGVGAKRIRELFDKARERAPAIVFIDELDAIGGKRSEKEASYHKQTLNQLLTELDGFDQDSGIIIIGATNFPESLDKALTRPGRFDRHITVDLPDVRGRMKLFTHYLKKVKPEAGIDTSIMARNTTGFSGADIENLVNQAAVRASKHKQKVVTALDLEWAIDKIAMGAEKKSMVMQDKDKLKTAYHEAGHALVGLYTPGSRQVHKATIIPRANALGITYFLPEMDQVSAKKMQMKAWIDVAMGGKAAEILIYGEDNVTSGPGGDIESATNIARSMIMHYGMSEKLGDVFYGRDMSPQARHTMEEEMRVIMADAYGRAAKLLTEKRVELERLAQALVKHELLDVEEIKKVIRGEELPEKTPSNPSSGISLPELEVPPGLHIPVPGSHTSISGSPEHTQQDSSDSKSA